MEAVEIVCSPFDRLADDGAAENMVKLFMTGKKAVVIGSLGRTC